MQLIEEALMYLVYIGNIRIILVNILIFIFTPYKLELESHGAE